VSTSLDKIFPHQLLKKENYLREEVLTMPTPSKPFTVLKAEGKSHRTKAELKQRERGEEALATGVTLKERSEVKDNPVAHKEFLRINKLLKNIEKNDAIYESVINRYCMLQAECKDFEEKRESFYRDIQELAEDKDKLINEISLSTYYRMKNNMQKQIIALDKQVQAKRKMLLDIEKENVMTIAAALRSIPKEAKTEENPLLKVLRD
jgi:ABC-type microcin C transport system permease subunit YejB